MFSRVLLSLALSCCSCSPRFHNFSSLRLCCLSFLLFEPISCTHLPWMARPLWECNSNISSCTLHHVLAVNLSSRMICHTNKDRDDDREVSSTLRQAIQKLLLQLRWTYQRHRP